MIAACTFSRLKDEQDRDKTINRIIKNLRDSKELKEDKREQLYKQLINHSKYLILYFSNQEIDNLGLSKCFNHALQHIKSYFNGRRVLFDGKVNFGVDVETMIKADTKIGSVMAASILAKVSRDRLMRTLDDLHPIYGFKSNKGYGTASHINLIKKFGASKLHRMSFLKNILS